MIITSLLQIFLLLSLQFTMTRIRSPLCIQTQALRLIPTLCLTIGVVGRVLKNVVRCSSNWSARLQTGAEQCFRSVKIMNFSPFLLLTCQSAVPLHSLYFLFCYLLHLIILIKLLFYVNDVLLDRLTCDNCSVHMYDDKAARPKAVYQIIKLINKTFKNLYLSLNNKLCY